MIYKLILALRNARYRDGRHSVKADVPTVCIGNVTVGGTGKTPHAEMLLRELRQSARWGQRSVAVLSRGYKRRSRGFQQLPADCDASFYGDEPAQIKHKFPEVTVAVDKDRVRGCSLLAHPEGAAQIKRCRAPQFPAAELIILDDAYQYRGLKASLDIVLTPFDRPVTRDRLLPAGRLRDLPSRLYDCDVVIVTKCPADLDVSEREEMARTLGYDSYDFGSCTATRRGRSQTLLFTTLAYRRPEPVFPDFDGHYLYSGKLVLFSGIADDTQLARWLSDGYKLVGHVHFPDHHRYTAADLRRLAAVLRRHPTAAFATTEKDAMRLRGMARFPQELSCRLFCVPVAAEFLSEEERQVFVNIIDNIV